MSKMRRYRPRDPSPSVAEPRRPLLLGAYSFVRAARLCPGVRRIALLGSLATVKAIPKDVDLLVTVERAMDLSQLARAGRRLKGVAQTINLGADIFLADKAAHYLGPTPRRTRRSRGDIAHQAGAGSVVLRNLDSEVRLRKQSGLSELWKRIIFRKAAGSRTVGAQPMQGWGRT